jgi:HK97 family phage portal protein
MKFVGARYGFDGETPPAGSPVALTGSGASMVDLFAPAGQNVGPVVTDRTAMQVGTVYACLEKLGGVVLQLPLHHYRINAVADRERVTPPSAVWWMLNESPAPAWTAAAWKEWIVLCVKLRGDQHTEILRGPRGEIVGLKPHHPDSVQVSTVDGRLRYAVWDAVTSRAYGVDQDDMLHFTGFGFDGECSVSAIKWAARNAISNSLSSAAYMGKALANNGMPSVSIEYPNKLDTEQAEVVRQSFVRTYLGPDSGQRFPFVATNGGKIVPLNITAVDLEIMAARRMDKAEICEALGVPPIIIGDSEKTSSWGTGVEQVTLGWVRFSVQPMLARWEEEINRKLFRRAGQFVEFSLEALLRGDSKAQSEAFRAAVGGPGTGDGWMTVNEIRALQNRPKDTSPDSDQLYRATRAAPTSATAPTP